MPANGVSPAVRLTNLIIHVIMRAVCGVSQNSNRGFSVENFYIAIGKRAFDLAVSFIVLIVGLPLLLLIALAIKGTSRGPIIFRQKRIGYREAEFEIFKFRTMFVGSGKSLDLVTRGDPRVTIVGKFLRKSHLDELLQVINVLRGEMSIVGWRPDESSIARELMEEIPAYRKVMWEGRPGITGAPPDCWERRDN